MNQDKDISDTNDNYEKLTDAIWKLINNVAGISFKPESNNTFFGVTEIIAYFDHKNAHMRASFKVNGYIEDYPCFELKVDEVKEGEF